MNGHVLITGGAGFIGSNLADRLASEGQPILVFDSLVRRGVERNLDWLRQRHPARVTARIGDVRDVQAITDAVRGAVAVFHFAAQVAVTSSLDDPWADLQVNLLGTATLLEALRRHAPATPLVFASTNKVYGGMNGVGLRAADERYVPEDAHLAAHGFAENCPLEFHTPYGCSKGAADQYVLDYARSFGLRTAVMRMSCIYGPRQLGTEDQGWVAHFLRRALARRPITIYGDGRQVRDVLHVGDAIGAYIAAWRRIDTIGGRAFNLGGGPANAVSLLQLVRHIGRTMGRPVELRFAPWRQNDQRYYVSDTRAVREALALPAPRDWADGVSALLRQFREAEPAPAPRATATALSA